MDTQSGFINGLLVLKQSTMLRQFTAMETTIAELNALGSFLGSQLASISAGAAT